MDGCVLLILAFLSFELPIMHENLNSRFLFVSIMIVPNIIAAHTILALYNTSSIIDHHFRSTYFFFESQENVQVQ